MTKTLIGIFLGLISLSSLAQSIDATRLFVKTNNPDQIKNWKHVSKVTPLFANNYLLHTNNLEALTAKLRKNKVQFEYNRIAKKSQLPKTLPDTQKNSFSDFFLGPSFFNDPEVAKIWSFSDAKNNGVSVNSYYLSPLSQQKEPIVVSVVDTGVEYTHDDLQDNMWVNDIEIPNNNIDDDQNGYVDDVYGINTLQRNENGEASGNPMPTHSHGTHVAGTIAATQNNELGIAGIASTAKIMAIRTVPDRSDETDADIIESFLYSAQNGAQIINCSFGKKHNEGGNIVNETITHIGKEYNVLVFASAGNEYGRDIDIEPKYPASFDSEYLVVVASTNSRGSLSYFSNIGKKSVDIAAPGSKIYSTVLNQGYGYKSGTSMATPTAVGVAAELWSNFPELTALQIKKILINSSVSVESFKNKLQAEGIIDLQTAVRYTLENYSSL